MNMIIITHYYLVIVRGWIRILFPIIIQQFWGNYMVMIITNMVQHLWDGDNDQTDGSSYLANNPKD